MIKKIAAAASNFSYLPIIIILLFFPIKVSSVVCDYSSGGGGRPIKNQNVYLRQVQVHCTVVRQRVIRRKSQHPDMWAVLMTRLHVHYWRSDQRRSPPLYYAKSERQPVYQLSRWHIILYGKSWSKPDRIR